MGKHNVSRIKYIPEPVFYRLWHSVAKFDTKQEYVHNFTSIFSKDYVDTARLQIDPGLFLDILFQIYKLGKMTVPEMITASGLSRASFGYRYCIPIRTLEAWDRTDTSPDYLRLLILKDLGLFQLPKYVHIEKRA